MSSPILPIAGLGDPINSIRPTAEGGSDAAFMSELDSARVISIGAGRGAAPAEVLAEVAEAGRLHDELRRDGHVLAFLSTDPGKAPAIELRDLRGNTLRTLTTAEAFAIAAGQPVE